MNSQYNKDGKESATLSLPLKPDLKEYFFFTTTENNCDAMETQ